MSVSIPDRRARAVVEAAMLSENPGTLTDFELTVNGENRDGDLEDSALEMSGGTANAFDATLGGAHPANLAGKHVSLDAVVGGVAVARFRGSVYKQGGALGQNILSRSGGFWLDKVEIGEPYAPLGYEPSRVIQEVAHKAPYASGLVRVEGIKTPLFTREKFEAYPASAKIAEVLDDVNSHVPLAVYDTPSGGLSVSRASPLPANSSAREYIVGRDLDEASFSAEKQDDLYFAVLVWRMENGVERTLAYQKVPNSTAPKGAVLRIETSDFGPTAEDDAEQVVHDRASELWRGNWTVTADLQWIDVLRTRGDTVTYVHDLSYPDGSTEQRTFRVRMEGIRETYPALGQQQSGPGVLGSVTKTAPPRAIVIQSGSGLARPLFGTDYLGRLYFGAPWVRYDPTKGLVFYPELAAESGISVTYDTTKGIRVTNAA